MSDRPMFDDEYAAAKLAARNAQELAAEAERDKQAMAARLGQAVSRAGQAEDRAAQLEKDLAAAQQTVTDAVGRAEHAQRLQLELNNTLDMLKTITSECSKATSKARDAVEARKLAERRAAESEATLLRRSEEFDRAHEVLAAFEQRTNADRVLAGS